jgi:hypothetical protein
VPLDFHQAFLSSSLRQSKLPFSSTSTPKNSMAGSSNRRRASARLKEAALARVGGGDHQLPFQLSLDFLLSLTILFVFSASSNGTRLLRRPRIQPYRTTPRSHTTILLRATMSATRSGSRRGATKPDASWKMFQRRPESPSSNGSISASSCWRPLTVNLLIDFNLTQL